MTPTEQRIAIAEACGWTGVIAGAIGAVGFPPGRAEAGERRTVIPAYTEDLNAMHEAEGWIPNGDQFTRYIAELHKACGGGESPYTAAAQIRAEAFLRTLNLWKEEV